MPEVTKNEEVIEASAVEAAPSLEEKTIVTFKKPYTFEGKEHKELDLSGIEQLTADDLVDAEKIFTAQGGFSPVPEVSPIFAFAIAGKAANLPLEFFRKLPIKEALKVKNAVVGFLNN